MGVRSNERYIEAAEKKLIGPLQEDLGRADSILTVLIPMRKSPQCWLLSQEARREEWRYVDREVEVRLLRD